MHEFGLCEGILDAVTRRARDRPVRTVRVRAGALLRVDRESLQSAFDMVAAGSVADGARVDLVVVPVSVSCSACGHAAEVSDVLDTCPGCGGHRLVHAGGDELTLESIELAAAAAGH